MTQYQSNNPKSVFASAEYDDSTRTAFLTIKNEADVGRAKTMLQAAGQKIITQAYVEGNTVLVSHGEDARDALFQKINQADGGNFAPEQQQKPTFLEFLRTNGWKIRGGSSVVGQSMTLFSAFNAVSKADADAGRLKPKFDPAIGAFAVLNLAANFVNYVFGGQKEEDINGLEKFDSVIAEEVNRHLPGGAPKLTVADVQKLSYMTDEELTQHNQNRSPTALMKRHSVRLGEVGLRTLGSLCMMFNYRKVLPALGELSRGNVKQAFLTAKVSDPNTFLAGCGMVAGKMMGLSAQTYDPNDPPKTYVGELRQKVFWITSSFTEMVAQSFVAFDRAKNKRLVLGGKPVYDYTGVVGNTLLTVPPYPTRLVLPYGEKVLDVNEVQARLLDVLPKLPREEVPGVAARVTARMVEHMGEKSPSFGELYSRVSKKLDAFHQICITPEKKEEAVEVEKTTPFSQKVERKDAKPKASVSAILNKEVDLSSSLQRV